VNLQPLHLVGVSVTAREWSWCDRPSWSYDIFYLYTLCARVTLTLFLFSPKLGHVTGITFWI